MDNRQEHINAFAMVREGMAFLERTMPLGARFPDGAYTLTLYAGDFLGNERTRSILVFLDNDLSYSGYCPNVS